MNSPKTEPLRVEPVRGQVCPVCGKRSYSRHGIHPQCAVQQADAPRQKKIAEAKRKQARQREAARAASQA